MPVESDKDDFYFSAFLDLSLIIFNASKTASGQAEKIETFHIFKKFENY